MSGRRRKRAIIVGGGPGGLTAAIALRRAGFDPIVFERASEIHRSGSGLTLWPNAIKALGRLGLAEAVQSASFQCDGIAMRSWRGGLLFDVEPPEQAEVLPGVHGYALHRAELVAVLLNALGEDTVKRGARCMGYRQDGQSVFAFFEDGSRVHGDVLIGADGIRSVIRAQMVGETKLEYAGFTVWRGVTQFILGGRVGLTSMGRGAQFGLFPMTQNRVYWFASVNAPEGARDWAVGRKSELLERFRGWHEPIEAIIEATNESTILRNDIYDQKPLDTWSNGHATLLGDAAHPSTPNLGQGACQAIEDAIVLATCLGENQEIASALKAYESRRIQRTSAITLQSRRLGQMGRWKNPALCWLRDKLIKSMPEHVRLQQINAVFNFDG
jgi:2-polyprenyl-6-methoxyphenol hydroxylase-like FAD-dependent oxidoreductase